MCAAGAGPRCHARDRWSVDQKGALTCRFHIGMGLRYAVEVADGEGLECQPGC